MAVTSPHGLAAIVSGIACAHVAADPPADPTRHDDGGPHSPRFGFVVHHNGEPDGTNGYSNVTEGVFGSRRTLLDDFEVFSGGHAVDGLRHYAIWNTLPPGSGVSMEIAIRADLGGTPGPVLEHAHVLSYEEIATGRTMFSRPEYEAWTEFSPVQLVEGRYWFEATVVGPENNYWLVTDRVSYEECWVNYDDLGGLQRGLDLFGQAKDLAWTLYGGFCGKYGACCFTDGSCVDVGNCGECVVLGGHFQGVGTRCNDVVCPCLADLDESRSVDFADVLALLTAWGACPRCPEDLDGNGRVDFEDVLIVLGRWGPCG